MRLITFAGERGPRAGAFIDSDSGIVDLQHAYQSRWKAVEPALSSVLEIARGGANALDMASQALAAGRAEAIPASSVRLMAPIPDLPQIRDFICFEKHLIQGFATARKVRARNAADPEAAVAEMEARGILKIADIWYERPLFYHPNRMNVVGHEHEIRWPRYTSLLDFELEFGCYIGSSGTDIRKDSARGHIFGYTIYNDVSARDEQIIDMPGQLGPGKGKTFDTSNVMGPCLVTADEIPDPYGLDMRVRVNGEEWGRGSSSEMHWKFEDCIAHVSRSETIHSGEFFGSGTVGNGCGMEQMRFLSPGDVVELEVERIGVLRNRVSERPPASSGI